MGRVLEHRLDADNGEVHAVNNLALYKVVVDSLMVHGLNIAVLVDREGLIWCIRRSREILFMYQVPSGKKSNLLTS